ncbi:protein sidekick-like isoform X3 [Tigriopus californicus]|uniref:protein sidekick-like isoform X3 n=1 Tax=Tigriopus californicus TaxID=6832 RepID=UPI0027D9D413|nr:protein sidekick-like isoform X3 [Tigriopus californicus]
MMRMKRLRKNSIFCWSKPSRFKDRGGSASRMVKFWCGTNHKLEPKTSASVICVLIALLGSGALPKTDASSLQGPRFITPPSAASGSIVGEGRTKILQCQALGFPQPEYRWMKDGSFLSDYTPEHFYKIQSISKKDAGNYQCYAKNEVGVIVSEKVPITVAFMAPFEDDQTEDVQVKAGHAAVFDLPPIASVPAPSVTWQAEDDSLLYGTKYATTEDNKFVILSVDSSDEKRYRARATNTQLGQEESSTFMYLEVFGDEVDVDVPPEIIIPPKDMTIVKGTPVSSLQCIANAKPLFELELIWLKDGVPIENSGVAFNFNDLWNRTLSLIQADFSHAGIYTCQVRMKTGGPKLTKDAKLEILENPTFAQRLPYETQGEFGKALTLPCDIQGQPQPEVKWLRNGVPLSETPNLRVSEMSNNSIHINFMRLEDSGMFQCTGENQAGTITGYTWLKVKTSSPIMVNGPTNMTAIDGKDATIPCEAEGAPTPNITWYLNDGQISFSGRIQILEDGSLLLAKVRSTDAGKYTCIRTNEAGSATGEAWVSVMVRTQIVQPPVDTKVILGHVATMACKVSADTNVLFDIKWFHEGRLINDEASHRIEIMEDGTLRIAEARASDAGEYTCEVDSPGGNDRHSSNLDVIELPYAPTSVLAERVSSGPKTVNVSWTPGFDGNSPIIKYILQYRYVPQKGTVPKDDMNWITTLANISASSRSVLLSNLRSSAAYIYRVSAVNSVGEGPQSAPSERVVLPQEPPSGPPRGLVGSARSEAEIMIQWQPPSEEAQNGDILGYIVRYRLFGYHESPWSYRNITKHLQRTYLVTELITWKDYEVQIAAYNSKGVGSYSSAIKVKTREGVPSAPPTGVRAQAVDSTVVRVWWYPPDPQKINGINQGYKLQAWRESNSINPVASVSVAPDVLNPLSEQSSVIDGLKPWTAYNITVLCFTSPGDGVRSPHELVRTHQDFPGPVSNLRFEDITDRGVRMMWELPSEPNGIITGFTIRYMVKDMIHTLVERNLTAEDMQFKLNNLKPTTHYTFEVYALTEVGRGKANVATIQSGVEPVLPLPPLRLAVSNIEPFSVVLQFTPGFDGNSSITKWTIQALSARNATWTTIYELPAEPDSKAITVKNLIPYMEYQLRLVANNVVGPSEPSEPTRQFQTIQAPPKHPPLNVTIRAMSATELRVRWIPLSQGEWYGIPRGYNISYRILTDTSQLNSLSIEDPTKNSFVIDGLEEFTLYEVLLQAYNDLGSSDPSPVVLARTREAAPGDGPSDISVEATSSTTILVKWGDVAKKHRNGIIEGFKVYYGAKSVPFKYKLIEGNATKQTTLTELKKYTKYAIQVLAYTRVGDGILSSPPLQERTYEDVPGPPSNVSFPDVSFTTARVIWDMPSEPNGEIKKYRVSYRLQKPESENFTREFLPTDRTFRAINLEPMSYYEFEVTAKTNLGWGYAGKGLVFTTNNREAPNPPSAPQISQSQVQDREITFSWNPGRDGYAPFRHYVVQFSENGAGWQTVPELVDPTTTTYTVKDLQPFTTYKFRLQAVNDIGPSGWSKESNITQTKPAAPRIPVENLKVTPITRTNVKVEWTPLNPEDFNGDAKSGGYQVEYREINDYPIPLQSAPRVELKGASMNKVILEDLGIGKNYEIIVKPINSQGQGPPSRPVPVYVGEAVPTGAPRNIKAEALSPTEVRLSWTAPEADQQNGDLLGYKIFYFSLPANSRNSEEIEVVSASHTSHSLIFLDMYTNYSISILAFNPAGEGPRSKSVSARTLQGIPGPPSNLKFSEITMNTLKVSWDPPEKPNGEILGYIVTYETAEQDENYSKQVKQRVSERFLFVHNLEESVTYTFFVRAQTIDYGPPMSGNVTTGPQKGSPSRPRELALSKTLSGIKLSWTNGNSGKGPILGYYIESRRKATEDWQIYEDKWKTETKTENGAVQEYSVPYQNLIPTTSYSFRVIAYNKYGISMPAKSADAITTPSKRYLEFGYLQTKPFYREPWFLVALAAASIVIIIMIVAILCVKSKTYKYKDQAKQQRLDENVSLEEPNYATFEMRQSRRGTLKSQRGTMRSTTSRKTNHTTATSNNFAMINGARIPPRPTPSLVRYSDEDDSARGYDENPDDSDSLTEKPSEISSTDSQGTESEQESTNGSDPHSFVNHYANVNSTLRQSWKKSKTAVAVPPPRAGSTLGTLPSRSQAGTLRSGATGRDVSTPQVPPQSSSSHNLQSSTYQSNNPRGYSSFTESDQDASSAVVSLNGTQIVMNNMARSRAPLPGFSSFV